MTITLWIFDILLALTLMALTIQILTAADHFNAVVLFIIFGLLMAVAWTRLNAVDIALAEAAIGAGLTGALFLNTLGHLRRDERANGKTAEEQSKDESADLPYSRSASSSFHSAALRRYQILGLLLILPLGIVLGAVVWGLPREAEGLAVHVERHIHESGATNPVTAVLLNFRGYDTLLEIGVLLMAVLGVWLLGPMAGVRRNVAPPGPVLLGLVRVLVPVIGVVGAYLLWIGTKEAGGAFQAGALLSAIGVLLLVSGLVRPPPLKSWLERVLLVAGFGGFLAVGLLVMLVTGELLRYPVQWAGNLILFVETLLTVSIALILVALFAGGPPE